MRHGRPVAGGSDTPVRGPQPSVAKVSPQGILSEIPFLSRYLPHPESVPTKQCMQIPMVLDNAKAGLAEIGGEFLTSSGFENEEPESDFSADFIAASLRED